MAKLLRAAKRAKALINQQGGLWAGMGAAARVLRREGWQGVRARIAGPAPSAAPAPATHAWNRPADEDDYAFELPFANPAPRDGRRACAIVHAFYPELCPDVRRYLENVPGQLDLYISTTSNQKRDEILQVFNGYAKGSVEIRVFENRGRDIAPKLVGFRDVYDRYDLALSLHTKKSPHAGAALEDWREYLYEHLLGSPEIVKSIFDLLARDRVGMVFPQHFFFLRDILGWGSNFATCRALLARMGIAIDENVMLECPSGSMFWCRTDALAKLLDLDLQFKDFDDEAGQIDGTLAHAIERAFLYAVEARGYTWAKVALRDRYPLPDTLIQVNEPEDVERGIGRVFRPLLGPATPGPT
jgi:lipopolysaccharide biosynthesis protein